MNDDFSQNKNNNNDIDDQNLDPWIRYKKTIKDVLVCDKVPKTNSDTVINLGVIRKRNVYFVHEKLHTYSYKNLSDAQKRYMEQYLDSCTFTFDSKYEISTHTRREKRRMSTPIKLDLHSCTLVDSPNQLKYFCAKCIEQDEREAIIITGKGSGKIKHATEQWINNNPSIILKYSPIYDSLHEVGSFYIWLRKRGIVFRSK